MKYIAKITLALLGGAMLYGADAEVRLVDSIAVHAPEITLGEIATIDCEDQELKKQLSQIVVTESPAVGIPRLVSAFKVRAALESAALKDRVELLGKQTTVITEARKVKDEELINLIDKWVKDNVEKGVRHEIDCFRLPISWEIPVGDEVKIVLENSRKKVGGDSVITMRAMAGDQVLSTMRAKVHVSLYADMPVLLEPLTRSDILQESDIEVQEVEITDHTGMEVTEFEDLLGLAPKRNLKAGSPLRKSDFVQPVVVERGDPVRILVDNGAVRLSITGAVAMQAARKGDIALFKNPMNNRQPLRAEVIGDGLAIIKLN